MQKDNNSIGIVIDNISIERLQGIEREREEVQSTKEFQNWCKQMRIGSRVEVKDTRANELMEGYENYHNWIKREEESRRWMPEFIIRMF